MNIGNGLQQIRKKGPRMSAVTAGQASETSVGIERGTNVRPSYVAQLNL
jgi:hypothetical protein